MTRHIQLPIVTIAEALADHLAGERMWEGRRDYRIAEAQAAVDDFARWRKEHG